VESKKGGEEMPSLFGKIANFARSPQGRRFASKAQQFVSKPENRRKISDLRSRLARKG
jgi:hypothetical protein